MKRIILLTLILAVIGIGALGEDGDMTWSENTRIADVINDPAFEGFGRLIFPAEASISSDMRDGVK